MLVCRWLAQGTDPSSVEFVDPNSLDLVALVSGKDVREYNPSGSVKILVVDVGLKYNQLRCLTRHGAHLKVCLLAGCVLGVWVSG